MWYSYFITYCKPLYWNSISWFVRESALSSYLQSIDNVKLRQGMYKRLQELFQKKVFHIVISERVVSRYIEAGG